MRSVNTIFVKQANDMFKNMGTLVQFLIFPVVALVMTRLIALPDPDMPNNMFVTMKAAMFAGMALIPTVIGIIAEDVERKSLKLLVMAGVKPHQYLLGIGGFILLAGTVAAVAFGLMGDFTGIEIVKFLAIMVAGTAASIILGATIGIVAKNRQSATSIGMPIAMVLGFAPMVANFNETIERFSFILYTQQLNVIVNDFDANFAEAMLIVGANIAVLTVLFAIAYKKKGLRG